MGLASAIARFFPGGNRTNVAEIKAEIDRENREDKQAAERELPDTCPDCDCEITHFKSGVGYFDGYTCECSLWVTSDHGLHKEELDF